MTQLQQKTYNLSGLTFAYVGAIISMAGFLPFVGVLIGPFLGAIFLVIGLFKLKDEPGRFQRPGAHPGKLAVLLVAAFVANFSGPVVSINGPWLGILWALGLVVYVVYGGLCWRNLLYGCRDVAVSKGNAALGRRCEGSWYAFIVPFILSAVVFVVAILWPTAMHQTKKLYHGTPVEEELA